LEAVLFLSTDVCFAIKLWSRTLCICWKKWLSYIKLSLTR